MNKLATGLLLVACFCLYKTYSAFQAFSNPTKECASAALEIENSALKRELYSVQMQLRAARGERPISEPDPYLTPEVEAPNEDNDLEVRENNQDLEDAQRETQQDHIYVRFEGETLLKAVRVNGFRIRINQDGKQELDEAVEEAKQWAWPQMKDNEDVFWILNHNLLAIYTGQKSKEKTE